MMACRNKMRVIARAFSMSFKEDADKHLPYGSLGSSLYSLATKGCFDVIENATPCDENNCISDPTTTQTSGL